MPYGALEAEWPGALALPEAEWAAGGWPEAEWPGPAWPEAEWGEPGWPGAEWLGAGDPFFFPLAVPFFARPLFAVRPLFALRPLFFPPLLAPLAFRPLFFPVVRPLVTVPAPFPLFFRFF